MTRKTQQSKTQVLFYLVLPLLRIEVYMWGGGRYANSALALDTLVEGEGEASLCRQNPSVGL